MMSIQVSTRIDESTKKQFDMVCERIGVSPSNALSMFIKGVINFNGIPFSVVAPATDQRMVDDLESKPVNQNLAAHTTAEEKKAAHLRMKELMADIDDDSVDLKQLRAERREARNKRERVD